MRKENRSSSLHRRALLNFLILLCGVSSGVIYLLSSLDEELEVLTRNPEQYTFREYVVRDADHFRRAIGDLRAKFPTYIPSDEFSNYFRDVRFILVLWWWLIACGGLWMVLNLSQLLDRELERVGKAIHRLVGGDISAPIFIRGTKEVAEIGDELEKLRSRLEASERHQLQFLQQVSHQIKTPLASIREGVDLLSDDILGQLNAEQVEVVTIVKKNSQELQAAIESLLNYNRAIADRSAVVRTRIELNKLVERAIANHSLSIRKKSLHINDNLTKIYAQVNPAQILTVFENLLANAVRYSPENGEIFIKLWSTRAQIVLTIQDEGPGIAKESRLAVFNAFFTGPPPQEAGIKGTGLGLSIARQYAELHGGTLEVKNPKYGMLQGALLQLTLPRSA